MDKERNIEKNPYINKDGQRELHKSIVVFIDILGFKSLVQNAKDEGKSQELFVDFHRVLSTWFDRMESMRDFPSFVKRKDNYIIRIFTDCVLIGCPIKKDGHKYNFVEGADEFFDVLSMVYLFQSEMVNQGYFVRGAVAVDELYMDDVIIYGNGVTEAYEAESKKAKFPRIILAKSAKHMFMEIDGNFIQKGEKNFLSHFVNKDSDGQLFLNYLESIKIGEDSYQFVDVLEKHKQVLERELSKYQGKAHILEKYIWSANYHNFFCNQPPYYNEYEIDLTKYRMSVVE